MPRMGSLVQAARNGKAALTKKVAEITAPKPPGPSAASVAQRLGGGGAPAQPAAAAAPNMSQAVRQGVQTMTPAPVTQMTPADRLGIDAAGRARGVAQGIGAQQAAGNAGLDALQGQILGAPAAQTSASPLQGARGMGAAAQGFTGGLGGPARQVSGAGSAAPGGLAPVGLGVGGRPGAGGSPLATGQGMGGIGAVDAALTGFDGRFAVPGAVQRESLPGTGQMASLPGREAASGLPGAASMGALPGATDRGLQQSALDRVLGFDPSVGSSVAQQQLRDATQSTLSSSLALARSARGGPAAQAQALRVAQGEQAATMSQAGRDAALLRAKEEDTRKARELEALGLGGDLSTAIRGSDVLERQQNVGALEAALNADVTQRGQTVSSLDNALNAGVTQRGQDVNSAIADRNAGVTERGQTISSIDNALNAGTTQRGQTIGANQAMNQQQLDAILGRAGLAQTERQSAVQERGQTLDAALGTEQIKQQRDAIAASSLSDAEKTEAQILMSKAALGYQLTPEEQFRMANLNGKLADKANDPSVFQNVLAGVQAVGSLASAAKTAAGGG